MSERVEFSQPQIDAAWDAALLENDIFDDMVKPAERQLQALNEVARYAIESKRADDHVIQWLAIGSDIVGAEVEAARAEFNEMRPEAVEVMAREDSPFAVGVRGPERDPRIEAILDRSSPYVTAQELRDFATAMGWDVKIASRTYTVLSDVADRIAENRLVEEIAAPLKVVKFFGKNNEPRSGLVKEVLRTNVVEWIAGTADLPYKLGVGSVSFLAAYFNALSDSPDDMLPVIAPPKPAADAAQERATEQAQLLELPLHELLLDKVVIDGEELWTVSNASLQRWEKSQGRSIQSMPHYAIIFQGLRTKYAPDAPWRTSAGDTSPRQLSPQVVFLGRRGTPASRAYVNDYGIPVSEFRRIVDELPVGDLPSYSENARGRFNAYLEVLAAIEGDFVHSRRVTAE